ALLAVLGSQIALADPASGARERLKTGGLLFAQALPFMAALFFLFPRSVAPLWGIPDNATATSGLSDSMSPGSISEMILSDDPAFTAEFDDKPPPPADRYWRGPVLSHFDGTTWRMALYPPQELPTYTPTGRRYSYKIMLEPHNQQWLPALDYPAGPVEGVRFNRDFQALSSTPVTRRARIALDAFPDTRVGLTEHGWTFRYAHQLPIRGNPRARALAAELKAGTSAKTVERILDWLAAGGFVYTLKPPRLKENNIDAFLFDTRMGFCEHFAGSFVFLARAADIPARVVTGYQGGRINPVDKTISVRQSDAHAWAEVWLAERGWVRVDPTALVAPLRIEYGLEGSLDTGLPFMLRPENSWLRQLRDRKEAFTMQWYRMVVGYDGRQQRDLLKNVGLNEFSVPVMLGAIAIATAFLMAAFYFWAQHRRENPDPLDRAWARFSARLAPLGLAREPAEGPLDYGRRLATIRPSEATTLMSICTRYARLRYCPPSSHKEICELTHAIDVLDIRKAKSRPP
ncbi:MAG: DUF3488 and transglutaminase-like domain-containing protein, partial [Azoarcus sp.]|nr:DUF3488 and transglutaminase-like domain-containing protein [Azoarcus sp.]